MANQRHVDILLHDGVAMWNLWRKEEPDIRPDLSDANLIEADLTDANLRGANLSGAFLSHAHLRGADLSDAHLDLANLSEANLSGANLSRADLSGASLLGANLSRADLSGADLIKAALFEADLTDANLRGANLSGAFLTKADLRGANLSGAFLTEASLDIANLRGAELIGANLSLAHLDIANLSRANLSEANLSGANLSRADLSGASLLGVNLSDADLSGADLSGADLSGALCLVTNFSHAILTRCTVYGISAWDLNLDNAKQADLRITPWRQANITVDNLEVAQFLYLLLSNPKVRTVLDTITSKVVLILGRFSEERKPVLDALREALRRHPNGYIPVLFDFDPQQDKPILETVKTLANLARFVIADLTDPHMVRSELTYITSNVPTVPVQAIIQGDADLPTEYGTWVLYKSFLPVYRYADLEQLLASLTEGVIAPVEGHVVARRLADADSR